jgi:ParB family chromosome partitioning protein
MVEIARRILSEQLTVRDVERLGREEKPVRTHIRAGLAEKSVAPQVRMITDRLRRHLQTDVQIVENGNARGEVRIRFYSADDLERLVELIAGRSNDDAS